MMGADGYTATMLMRSLIVLLVMLNLGVALWQGFAAPAVPKPEPVTLPPGTPGLQVVGEAAPRAASPAAASPAPNSPATAAAPAPVIAGSGQCFAFGPVDSVPGAQALSGLAVGTPRHTPRPAEPAPRAWRVVSPPQADGVAAKALQQRLIAAGFTDQILLSQGEEAHTIALGRFGQRANAQRHQATLAEKGFPTQVQPADSVVEPSIAFELADGVTPDQVRHRLQLLRASPVDCAGLR